MNFNFIFSYPRFSYNVKTVKGVIWCDFKFSFLFGVLQADSA